jgi:hypothetical protein
VTDFGQQREEREREKRERGRERERERRERREYVSCMDVWLCGSIFAEIYLYNLY